MVTNAGETGRRHGHAGITLIELLVAMSIAAVIGSMIIISWVALTKSYANTVRRGEAGDWARLSLSRMAREIRDAEQPSASVAEVGLVRARPYFVVLYTTFNKSGNASSTTPPRLVMYRLYANGELWRFHDANGDGSIAGVDISAESWPGIAFALGERGSGEGGQMMSRNIVNASTPNTSSPTALFTYVSYASDGTLARALDVRGTADRSQVKAVEVNLLLDMNPGKSPVYTQLRTTAQLRNTR